MKKAPLPTEDAPRMVVAVPSIEFAFTLWNATTGKAEKTARPRFALWNPETKELNRIIGGNVCANTAYIHGIMPKVFRMAVEDQDFAYERIFTENGQLPSTLEEKALDEHPELQVVVTNWMFVPMPDMIAEAKPKAECTIIETEYARAVRQKKEADDYAKKAEEDRKKGLIPLQLDFTSQLFNKQTA